MLTDEKRQIIEEALKTDEGILMVAKGATSYILDPVERELREAHMVALLKVSRAGRSYFK